MVSTVTVQPFNNKYVKQNRFQIRLFFQFDLENNQNSQYTSEYHHLFRNQDRNAKTLTDATD